jgi:hypothetical protein
VTPGDSGGGSDATRRTLLKLAGAAGAGLLSSGTATAAPAWTVTGPDGDRRATVRNPVGDPPTLTVEYLGPDGPRTLLECPLGLRTADAEFTRFLSFLGRTDRRVDETYTTPAGKRREHGHRAVEMTLAFEDLSGRPFEVDVRAAAEGVAYRYRLPGNGNVAVTGEASGFRVETGTDAWLLPYNSNYENSWEQHTVGRARSPSSESRFFTLPSPQGAAEDTWCFPALFQVEDRRWVLVTEADVDGRYAASRIAGGDGGSGLFDLEFPEERIETTRPLETPWRVAVTGELDDVVESDLVTGLSPASRLEDDGWVDPGRVAWSWWSDEEWVGYFLRVQEQSFEEQKRYVDYAAERGWEHVLVDQGWSPEWMPDLVEYADERDVGIFAWERWTNLNTEAKRDARLPEWKEWGVAGIKVDFMSSDTQARMGFYDDLLSYTADLELMVNFHGSTLPRGRRRRWPHLMTSEAVRGAEFYKFGTNLPSHNVTIPFTRDVTGPTDYTPVTFSAENRLTSAGHELALSVAYESGLQHFADSPESYGDRPLAESFLEAVPAAWDETVLVGGRPGRRATVARRSGGEWFLGTIVAGEPRTIDVPLSFLGGGPYRARVVGEDAAGESLREERAVLDADDTLSVEVAENGGFVAHFGRGATDGPP